MASGGVFTTPDPELEILRAAIAKLSYRLQQTVRAGHLLREALEEEMVGHACHSKEAAMALTAWTQVTRHGDIP